MGSERRGSLLRGIVSVVLYFYIYKLGYSTLLTMRGHNASDFKHIHFHYT